MFYDTLCRLCSERNTTVTETLINLGYSSSKGTAWKKGSIPKSKILQEIANYLCVPVYYLFMSEDELDKIQNTSRPLNLSDDDWEIIREYRKLSFEGKNAVRMLIQTENEKTKSQRLEGRKTGTG
jgi:hypothetical protein